MKLLLSFLRMPNQTTIGAAVETEGIGLHTGVHCRMRFTPAPADTGIVFRRTDLDNFRIEAHGRNVARVSYETSLMKKGIWLSTTEHVLAAIYSCGIDNIFIDVDALELPILDGSARPFLDMIDYAGIVKLRRRRCYLKVLKHVEVSDGDRRIGIYPADDLRIGVFVEFAHPLVRQQRVNLVVNRESFAKLLSTARTFCFLEDVERLRAAGLARGGSLDNAIVLTRDGVMNGPLRTPDEFVRHKALDLVGDLALLGRPLLGRVEAHKAGHALHTQLVSKLLGNPSLWMETSSPELEPDTVTHRPALKRSVSAHAAD
ncbi:MAG TPA: UDP-3-O-acyl-N-acetylglucosamine deacetylase [Candidatus Limnocylindrales bacterium]|nr:UDP-3-O-acyl-N-acetylglucosamine deacetylase [Candidatus Limnocylindrales bacterium]